MRRAALTPCLALACTLTGDGVPGSVTRSLPVFDAVEVFDGFTVALTVEPALAAESIALELSGDANALGRLFAAVHGDATLSLGVDPNHLTELRLVPGAAARVPALRRVFAADTSAVAVTGAREALEIELHESATLTLTDAEAVALEVLADGEAALSLAGHGPTLRVVAGGTATIDARGFAAAAVRVEHAGTGEVLVCATETIVIRGSGAARVRLDCG